MQVAKDSTEPFTIYVGATGLTLTCTLKKQGGSWASVSPGQADDGNGWYTITPSAGHRDTLGQLCWNCVSGANLGIRSEEVVNYNPRQAVADAADSAAVAAQNSQVA